MNIFNKQSDKHGNTWAISAQNNRFYIVFKKAGCQWWETNSEVYNDPDPAIKALKRRIAMMDAV